MTINDIAKPSLIGMTRDELRAALTELGVGDKQLRMRVNQIWGWLYAHGVCEFDQMSNVAKQLRDKLAAAYTLDRLEMAEAHLSEDGTRKYLFRLRDGQLVETVYIPEVGRGTLCVSSQVGCTLTCRFCHTGTQKLVRNLTAAEITGQMVAARDDLDDWGHNPASNSGTRKVTNVVMMGMGEPLYNGDQVADALNVMSDGDGLSLSKRRITLSTSGVVPEIAPMG
ncbi:MAG: 23S rRNA (adenine(2503)-C(2))-methyltransferase RlmN, partial [Parvibaculales bacterium]